MWCINFFIGFIKLVFGLIFKVLFLCVVVDYGVVMGGVLNGSYLIRRFDGIVLDVVEGFIIWVVGGGVNYMDMYISWGFNFFYVGICSNDSYFWVMDFWI